MKLEFRFADENVTRRFSPRANGTAEDEDELEKEAIDCGNDDDDDDDDDFLSISSICEDLDNPKCSKRSVDTQNIRAMTRRRRSPYFSYHLDMVGQTTGFRMQVGSRIPKNS